MQLCTQVNTAKTGQSRITINQHHPC